MCGRYVRRSDKQHIAERFRLGKLPADFPLPPDFNVAPTTFQPVIRNARETDERELVQMRWGLVPFFAGSLEKYRGYSTFNARAERVTASHTFAGPFAKRRCLVPADAFYEWQIVHPDGTTESAAPGKKAGTKATKRPFAFSLQSGQPFAFAGLWDAWKAPDGSWLQSYSIITTDANELMAPVHTRMPVILAERDWSRWLSRDDAGQPPIDLLRPFDADLMQAALCSPLVGNVRNNGPELLLCPNALATVEPLNSK